MLADILLDGSIQAARIGVGIEGGMLITEKLPSLVDLIALDLD